jgi:predicted phage terminase large subunit-like protein
VQLAGAMFKRDQVRVLEAEPAGVRWVRSWDLAFTQKTTSDFSVGAKIGMMPDGTVVVADIIRGRWEWPAAVRKIGETATADGVAVQQGIEVVGAQVGAIQTLLADPLLAGFAFTSIQVHADKITRALPVVARCEQGKLAIVRGGWNREFLDELSAFPEVRHDDQVDAVSGGFTLLSPSPSEGALNEKTAREFIALNTPRLGETNCGLRKWEFPERPSWRPMPPGPGDIKTIFSH